MQFDVTVSYGIYYMYHVFSVCISNMRPSPLDICPRLRLGQISRGLGLILLIHTSKPWYIYYINLVCRNDAIIMQYIIYSILELSDIQNIGPVVGVLGCDIALGPSALGLYHILGHPPQVLYFVYQTVPVYYI